MNSDEIFCRLAALLAIGLLIGLERGWRAREESEGERALGSEPMRFPACWAESLGSSPRQLAP